MAFPTGLDPFHSNPDHKINATHATSQLTHPTEAPYVCHWDSRNNEVWYPMDWNHYITLRCSLVIDFNIALTVLADV